jgi:hypothetical protein
MAEFNELIGKVLTDVQRIGDDELVFTCNDGKKFKLWHGQDCCESVTIDDVAGDLSDLIGEPILRAEETTSDQNPDGLAKDDQDSFTWTFYKLATRKGYVDIRWYGKSNGYYSERVDFYEV